MCERLSVSGQSELVAVDDLRLRSVERLMSRYDFPRFHAEQVRLLADRLADQLAGELLLGSESRLILSCAALLHDIGWHFGQAKHHRRAYDLIKADGLSGFAPEQVELIAQVARYHRKAQPKIRHQTFAGLNAIDRQTVTKLAAILRVADGLDRSHRSVIEDVTVRLSRRQVRLMLKTRFDDVEQELWAAGRKRGLLETVLGRTVVFGVGQDQARPGSASC